MHSLPKSREMQAAIVEEIYNWRFIVQLAVNEDNECEISFSKNLHSTNSSDVSFLQWKRSEAKRNVEHSTLADFVVFIVEPKWKIKPMPKKRRNEINLSFQLNEWMNEPKWEQGSGKRGVQLKIQFQKMYCTWNAFRTSDILHMNPCQITTRLLSFSHSVSLICLRTRLLLFSKKRLRTVGSRCFTRRMFRFLWLVIFRQLPSYHIQFTCKGWLHMHIALSNI